ncbi:hypothetical protein B0A49_04331 [Cryomyces minteri]|uniref:OTU domain-containing protein n=1 Tax=Cryomyces minteri TaxID=331657 RepID=A0A4U0XAJ8_9PEZI|nr:hypothetical protein B0A49_04331 [Cryomyces minteri]
MAPRTQFGQRKRRRAKTTAPVARAAQSVTAAPDKKPTQPRTSAPRGRGTPNPRDDDLEALRDMYTVIGRPAPNRLTKERLREDLDTYSDELEATARALCLLSDQDLRPVDQSRWQLRQELGHAILEEVRPMTDRHGNVLSREDFKKIVFLETERLRRQCYSKTLQTSDDAGAMFEALVNYGSRGWGRELLGGDLLEDLQQHCVYRGLENDGSECELFRRLLDYEVAARNLRSAEELELRVVTKEDKARRLQKEREKKKAAQRLQAEAAELASAEVHLAREPQLQGFRFHENIWFHQTNVVGDGSCFWRAFAAAYYGDQEKWTDVRDAARTIWRRAVEDPTDNHVSRRRRTLYQHLDRQSVPSGPPREDNCHLTDQLTVDGAWCTQEMLQLLADTYNVELFAHFPLNTTMVNSRPVAEDWGLTVRGVDRQDTNRRQIHLVNYMNAAHWTAVWAEANFQYTDHLIHDQNDPMHLMPTLDNQLGEHAWRPLRRRGSHDSYATDLSASDGERPESRERPSCWHAAAKARLSVPEQSDSSRTPVGSARSTGESSASPADESSCSASEPSAFPTRESSTHSMCEPSTRATSEPSACSTGESSTSPASEITACSTAEPSEGVSSSILFPRPKSQTATRRRDGFPRLSCSACPRLPPGVSAYVLFFSPPYSSSSSYPSSPSSSSSYSFSSTTHLPSSSTRSATAW